MFLNTHFTLAFIGSGPYSTQLTTLMQMTGLTANLSSNVKTVFAPQKSHPSILENNFRKKKKNNQNVCNVFQRIVADPPEVVAVQSPVHASLGWGVNISCDVW